MSGHEQARTKTGRKPGWFNPFAREASVVRRVVAVVVWVVIAYLLATPVVCFYEYSRAFPPFFDPQAEAKAQGFDSKQLKIQGVVFTTTLVKLTDSLLVSWLPNDVVYPAIFLDNPQNFQLGVLELLRYATRVLRDTLSRQRTTDKIDPYADAAYTALSNNPRLWIFPAAESKLREARAALVRYRKGLVEGTSHFYPRADNLIELLDQLTSLLGGVDTRLGNAPGDWSVRLSEETAGDRYSGGEKPVVVKVPWWEVDDNFYFARGVAYGLREVLMAVAVEFRAVLRLKRSEELMDNIIQELALAQFEPLVVLNGARESIFANHSLKLMATLEDVRQKLINVEHMLER